MEKNLAYRQHSEQVFHDQKYSLGLKRETLYDLSFTSSVLNRLLSKLNELNGKKVLDFGCGTGWLSEFLLTQGAEVWAIDISEEAVKRAKEVAVRSNAEERMHASVMAAEALTFESNFFDYVIGTAILHHLDLGLACREIHRVLKTTGRAIFMEPLGHNPIINFYRFLTPNIRSVDEKPLKSEHIFSIRKKFSGFEIETFYLFAIFGLFWFYIIKNKSLMLRTRDFFQRIDNIMLRKLPSMNKYCWYAILTLIK